MTIDTDHDRVDALLFDLDGTLIETDNRWAETLSKKLAPLRRVFRALDVDSVARALVMSIEMPANYAVSILERLGLTPLMSSLADRIRRSKGLATRDGVDIVEGAEALLESLEGHFQLAVVTTRARREAWAFLRQSGFDRFFPVVVTRQDAFRMKPHPAPIRRAARLLGTKPSRCVMVGDTRMDIRSARRAGAYPVAVLSGFGSRRELERAGAALVLDSVADLPDHLPALKEAPEGGTYT